MKSPSVSVEPDEHQVAERVALELAAVGSGARTPRATPPSSPASATRHLRMSPGGGHAEVAPQPARRAAVVGDAHHRGDRARVAADGAQRDGEAVPAAERDDRRAGSGARQPRSTSRWWTLADTPCGSSRRAELLGDRRRCGAGRRCSRRRSRGTTCPRARTPGSSSANSRSSSSRNGPVSGCAST